MPREILYDRMKTAVIGEDPDGLVIYNRALLDLARHYGFQPRMVKLSVRSATFAMTSSSAHHSGTSTTSISNFAGGLIRSPILAYTRPRNVSSMKPSPKKSRR